MKTDNSQSIRRNRWFRLASSLMATLFLITCIASCSEEDISGDITGKYGNLTGADDTVITIGTRGDGYTMKCTYEDFGSGEYFEWNGTFKNLPTDAVDWFQRRRNRRNSFQRNRCRNLYGLHSAKRTVTRLTVMS